MAPSRRRFLSIAAAACALPGAAMANAQTVRWTGVALGAPASVTLVGINAIDARPVFARLEAELARLERIFSLYRADSALVRLNQTGRLAAPPPELLGLLRLAGRIHAVTEGAFDPTVQPLWQALANGADIAAARRCVGWEGVHFDAQEIRFDRPGMALTLNGIAQGEITDRVAALLGGQGFGDILVDIGEIVARGQRPDGGPWQAGIATPQGEIVQRVTLSDRALATSAPNGTRLAADQGHIIGPKGQGPRHSLVSLSAPNAALADGLSTALCLLDGPSAQAAVQRFPGVKIEVIA